MRPLTDIARCIVVEDAAGTDRHLIIWSMSEIEILSADYRFSESEHTNSGGSDTQRPAEQGQ